MGRYGHAVSGTGNQGNPQVHRFDPRVDNILGPGLEWNEQQKKLATKVSGDAGQLLGYGSDDGLLVTGIPDPGFGGRTVASLPATHILCGTYGAGYQQFAEASPKAYEAALENPDITMVHVPVRRSRDLMLWAMHNRNIASYTGDTTSERTDTLDQKMGALFRMRPSGEPVAPLGGYFGFYQPPFTGLVGLNDVFRITARRVVLYLESKDLGGPNDTPAPGTTLAATVALVTHWGLRKSVIIGSELPTSNADLPAIKQGLADAAAAEIAVAAHLTSNAQVDANTPDDLKALGITWVMIAFAVPPEKVTPYIDAGLNVMLHLADRQTHWIAHEAVGARGVLSSDPAYVAGGTYGFRYRKINPQLENPPIPQTWGFGTPDHGRVGYSGTLLGAHSKFRGYVAPGVPHVLVMPPTAVPPADSGYNSPMGEFCPVHDPTNQNPPYGLPTNYDLACGFSATIVQPGGTQALGFFLGNTLDGRLFDLFAARTDTRGYSFVLASNGQFLLRRYDGVAGGWQFVHEWASGWGASSPNTVRRLMVQVRPGTIRCGPADAITGPNSRLFEADNPAGARGDLWRGGYFYLTYDLKDDESYTGDIKWHNLEVTNH